MRGEGFTAGVEGRCGRRKEEQHKPWGVGGAGGAMAVGCGGSVEGVGGALRG
jgi:hypothetical protein